MNFIFFSSSSFTLCPVTKGKTLAAHVHICRKDIFCWRKSLKFFFFLNLNCFFKVVVKHSHVNKLYVASVFPLLFLCVAKYEWCAASCTAFTLIFSPVVHSSHNLLDWFSPAGFFLNHSCWISFPPTSLLIDYHQVYECGRIAGFFTLFLFFWASKFSIGFYWGRDVWGAGLASLWCKCCANVVVPLVTVKGQTESRPLQCIFGVGKGPLTQLVFHWTPDKQFCAHNKDFTHENVHFLSFLCPRWWSVQNN